MRISNLLLMVAKTQDGVIGYRDPEGKEHLPFKERLIGDLPRVKRLTTGHTIIMGRTTFEKTAGSPFPLPNRMHFILSRKSLNAVVNQNHELYLDNAGACRHLMANTPQQVIKFVKNHPDERFFVFGGKEIYTAFLPFVNQCLVTTANYNFDSTGFTKAQITEVRDLSFGDQVDEVITLENNIVESRYFSDSKHLLDIEL